MSKPTTDVHVYWKSWTLYTSLCNAAFRLASRFDGDFCTTAQAPLAAEERPSGKQRQANQSITSPLCPQRQIADSWLLFNFRAMPRGEKAKAAWPLRAATLKQQAVIRRWSNIAASGSVVWNQLNASSVTGLWFWCTLRRSKSKPVHRNLLTFHLYSFQFSARTLGGNL